MHAFRLVLTRATGTVYFDDFQLECGETNSSFNYIANGNFENGTFGKSGGSGDSIVSGTQHDGYEGKMLKLNGGYELNSEYSQRIEVNAPAGTTFLLSGWGKADSVGSNLYPASRVIVACTPKSSIAL